MTNESRSKFDDPAYREAWNAGYRQAHRDRDEQAVTQDEEAIELAAEWLHSWAGDQVGHAWEQCGPARKATMLARARGVANILDHGHPGDVS